MFNLLLSSYYSVNYSDFLFLSFLKKKNAQTSTLLTTARPARPARSAWSLHVHMEGAAPATSSQKVFSSCSSWMLIVLCQLLTGGIHCSFSSEKIKMSLTKSNKLPSLDVKQENKIAQWAVEHFSFYRLSDTTSIPDEAPRVHVDSM